MSDRTTTESSQDPSDPPRMDGRVRRGVRNRQKIIDALYDLVRDGEARPTAEMIANHAAVGDRTVFRHFQDMKKLHDDLSARVAAEVMEIIASSSRPSGALARRVSGLIKQRSRIYEHIAPFRRTAQRFAGLKSVRVEPHLQIDPYMRATLSETLAPEIGDLSPEQVEALDAILSFEFWDRLRFNQNQSATKATKVVERAVLAIFDATDTKAGSKKKR